MVFQIVQSHSQPSTLFNCCTLYLQGTGLVRDKETTRIVSMSAVHNNLLLLCEASLNYVMQTSLSLERTKITTKENITKRTQATIVNPRALEMGVWFVEMLNYKRLKQHWESRAKHEQWMNNNLLGFLKICVNVEYQFCLTTITVIERTKRTKKYFSVITYSNDSREMLSCSVLLNLSYKWINIQEAHLQLSVALILSEHTCKSSNTWLSQQSRVTVGAVHIIRTATYIYKG